MPLISVVENLCKRDGICADVCPAAIIEFKDKDSFPTMIEGGEEVCIHCGHCVAVCPHGALNHESMQADQCPPIRKEAMVSAEQAEQFLRQRRSIRTYKERSVDRDQLERLIQIARYAPSGHNTQPVSWTVIYERQEVHRLAGMVVDWMRSLIAEGSPLVEMLHLDRVIQSWEAGTERIFRNAPHLIIAHADQEGRTAQSGCTIALTYLELMATGFGLGACWAGYFTAASLFWPPIMEALELPRGHVVFGALMIGHPKYRYHRMPLRNEPNITWR